jgi:hypothetical protein
VWIVNQRYRVLTQKAQKNLVEVFENFVIKKPTLFGIGLVFSVWIENQRYRDYILSSNLIY